MTLIKTIFLCPENFSFFLILNPPPPKLGASCPKTLQWKAQNEDSSWYFYFYIAHLKNIARYSNYMSLNSPLDLSFEFSLTFANVLSSAALIISFYQFFNSKSNLPEKWLPSPPFQPFLYKHFTFSTHLFRSRDRW